MGHPRPMGYAAALATALIASPVVAQVTTDCSTLGQFTNCRTYGLPEQPSAADVMIQNMLKPQPGPSIMDVINARKAERAARQQADAEQAREDHSAYLRRQAGQMVAAGDCTGARNLVLNEGDFEAAQAVDGVCKAAAADPQLLAPKHP